MDFLCQGIGTPYWNDILAPDLPWHRASRRDDARNFPARGGGRELRHPYLPRIAYPRLPDRTLNFGYDVLLKTRSVKTKTLTSTGVNKFIDAVEDVVIQEVWLADQLSTLTSFFHGVKSFLNSVMPPGRYIGWLPRDLTHKAYFVELLDVQVGPPDDYLIEEIGRATPFMMREAMTISLKCIREQFAPAGIVIGEGL